MKRMVYVTILECFVTTGLCADTPPPALPVAPSMLLPSFELSGTMARLNEKGQVVLKFQVAQYVPMTATRILRDGKEVEEKHTFYETVTKSEDQAYDPKEIKLIGSDGKPLDKKMLPELLKEERPVLFIYGDGKIDSTFLKLIKEGTPILILPAPNPS